ncbi:NADH dehydrogenase 1 alpha subcomplex subunit 10, mitochondrial [Caerostris extrusa]|uniref:NADH dehydrogenase 1 alpha subcomplex subunit 10, mitochondrial n=1 Tax=Caerostris extrusa TaxID=172846 RepID=A0AAV4MW40_CAEEX|nr:NADH dehydrogenase 1 alpha subcomplex subunit 10, mitochondrial [Caerostris extrusa]
MEILEQENLTFAKELAEAFDMRYFPEPTLEPTYITPYGYDLRKLDPIAPPSFKICDLDTFLRQGVVMERSVYGDFVFFEAMFKAGYLSQRVKDLYYDINQVTLEELMRPHLIIYLDASPDVLLERIKKRNNPIEVNSPVLTKEYLESIEYFYKQKYLKDFQKYSEIIIYDWNNYGDVEVVVEDIERLDFDRFTQYHSQLKDWRKWDDWEWSHYRRYYTNSKREIMQLGLIFRPRVSEVHHPGAEVVEYLDLLREVPGERYIEGFNPKSGDNVWFKTFHKSYRHASYDRDQQA